MTAPRTHYAPGGDVVCRYITGVGLPYGDTMWGAGRGRVRTTVNRCDVTCSVCLGMIPPDYGSPVEDPSIGDRVVVLATLEKRPGAARGDERRRVRGEVQPRLAWVVGFATVAMRWRVVHDYDGNYATVSERANVVRVRFSLRGREMAALPADVRAVIDAAGGAL